MRRLRQAKMSKILVVRATQAIRLQSHIMQSELQELGHTSFERNSLFDHS